MVRIDTPIPTDRYYVVLTTEQLIAVRRFIEETAPDYFHHNVEEDWPQRDRDALDAGYARIARAAWPCLANLGPDRPFCGLGESHPVHVNLDDSRAIDHAYVPDPNLPVREPTS